MRPCSSCYTFLQCTYVHNKYTHFMIIFLGFLGDIKWNIFQIGDIGVLQWTWEVIMIQTSLMEYVPMELTILRNKNIGLSHGEAVR